MYRVLKVTRNQLSAFIKDHKTLIEFERLIDSDNNLVILVENIIGGTGLQADGTYIARAGSNYLDLSTDISNDITLLDTAIFDYTREYITKITLDAGILPTAQTVLCDATSGDINITMPPPANCFSNGRSLRFAIHKIDITSNVVNIIPNSGELIVGSVSQTLKRRGDVLNFITDGINWYLGS